ncbi:MAG TPA: hypothetical protein VNH18_10145, partial [Bryobacteraceae bacterium]|nr:hypothetical protein [Bryobacteraceae bacterium]
MKTLTEFTANDPIVGDRATYAEFTAELEAVLQPLGMLEIIFAAEIVRATWKLQYLKVDKPQFGVDYFSHFNKIRSVAQTTIRWATTELRRIQTARRIREEQELPD